MSDPTKTTSKKNQTRKTSQKDNQGFVECVPVHSKYSLSESELVKSPYEYTCLCVSTKVVTWVILIWSLLQFILDTLLLSSYTFSEVNLITVILGVYESYQDCTFLKVTPWCCQCISLAGLMLSLILKKENMLIPYLVSQWILSCAWSVVALLYPLMAIFSTNYGFLYAGSADAFEELRDYIPQSLRANPKYFRYSTVVYWSMFGSVVIAAASNIFFYRIALRFYRHLKFQRNRC